MLNDVATPIIKAGIDSIRSQVVESQKAKRIRDTGRSANSLRITVASTDTSVSGQLYGSSVFLWQERGRGPNKSRKPSRQMIDDIREWTKRHGIEEKAAYPIALNIARNGIEVPNRHNPGRVLSDVLNDDNTRKELGAALRKGLKSEFKSILFQSK